MDKLMYDRKAITINFIISGHVTFFVKSHCAFMTHLPGTACFNVVHSDSAITLCTCIILYTSLVTDHVLRSQKKTHKPCHIHSGKLCRIML